MKIDSSETHKFNELDILEPINSASTVAPMRLLKYQWVECSASTTRIDDFKPTDLKNMPLSDYDKIRTMLNNQGFNMFGDFCTNSVVTDTRSSTRKRAFELEWVREIRNLVESGDVAKARRLLVKIGANRVSYYGLNRWKFLLDPPKAIHRKNATGIPFSISTKILKTKIKECKGEWVALLGDEFLGSNKSKIALYRSLKSKNKLKGTMFIYAES